MASRQKSSRDTFNLSDADRQRQIIKIRCSFCRTVRRYLPVDLMAVFGDIEVDAVDRGASCDHCGRRSYLDVRCESINGPTTVRRLVEIRTVQMPIWREEGI